MAKADKGMTKEELRAPDEIETVLKGFWEKLYAHRKLILIGVGAIIAIGLVSWIVGSSKRSSGEASSLALYEASLPIGADVGPEEPMDPRMAKLPRPPRFADEAARQTAAHDKLQAYVAERSGDGAAELAQVALANAKLNKGDALGALAEVDKWLAAYSDSPALPLALELKARAQVAAGQKGNALATLDSLSKSVTGLFKAEVLGRIGDLQNPVLNNDGSGDATLSKNAYLAALAALPPEAGEKDQLSSIVGKPGLRGQLETRMGFLP
jgi:hypothetical protein